MGTARDHRDLDPRAQELRAEVAADTARPHHHDVHETYDTLRPSHGIARTTRGDRHRARRRASPESSVAELIVGRVGAAGVGVQRARLRGGMGSAVLYLAWL